MLYKSGRLVVVNGSWITRGMQFAQPAQPSHLAILVLDGDLSQFGGKEDADLCRAVNVLLSRWSGGGPSSSWASSIFLQPDDPFREETPLAIANSTTSSRQPRMVIALVIFRVAPIQFCVQSAH